MYWFRELPKSMKWLIILIVSSLVLLTTNFIFYKMATKEEPFNNLDYLVETTGLSKSVVEERLVSLGIDDISTYKKEELQGVFSDLNSFGKDVDKEYDSYFTNKNKKIMNEEQDILNYDALIVSYGVKDGLSDKELVDVIKNAKEQGIDKVYSFSNENGYNAHQLYYNIAEDYYNYVNRLEQFEGLDDRFNDNQFDYRHIGFSSGITVPQYYVVKKGMLDMETTKKLSDVIFLIDTNGETGGVFID